MLPLIFSFILIAVFFSIESRLRFGEEAKSLDAAERDKKSTSYIFKIFGINILCLLSVFIFNYFNLFKLFNNPFTAFVGIVLMLLGLFFRIYAVITLREYYTRTLKTITNQKIIAKGMYKFIRHPGYLGLILIWIGAGVSSNNYLALIIISILTISVYQFRIINEEKMLIEAFGDEYIKYKKNTWRLLPPLY